MIKVDPPVGVFDKFSCKKGKITNKAAVLTK